MAKTDATPIGARFGCWTVTGPAKNSPSRQICWSLRCDCGTIAVRPRAILIRGLSKSCWCMGDRSFLKTGPGERFGRLVFIETVQGKRNGRIYWRMICDCGVAKDFAANHIRGGRIVSCGCYKSEITGKRAKVENRTHGLSDQPIYRVWHGMIRRCHQPSSHNYRLYGARGICVADYWRYSFETFARDMLPTYRSGLSIERIDNNGNYAPGNVKWADAKEQARNVRHNVIIDTPAGPMVMAAAAEHFGIPYARLSSRVKAGWPADRFFEPMTERYRKAAESSALTRQRQNAAPHPAST